MVQSATGAEGTEEDLVSHAVHVGSGLLFIKLIKVSASQSATREAREGL